MLFNWLKQLFDAIKSLRKPRSIYKGPGGNNMASFEELEKRQKRTRITNVKVSNSDWYKISVDKQADVNVKEFEPYQFEKIESLKDIKDARLAKEAAKLKELETEVKLLINSVQQKIAARNTGEAKVILDNISRKIILVKDSELQASYEQVKSLYAKCLKELEQERLRLAAEEKRRREEEQRRIELARIQAEKERAERERKERERREAEAKRLAEEARKREQAEQAEKNRLKQLSTERKDNCQAYAQVLAQNNVRYLYHFTDRRNLQSIRRHGGLLSWDYCEKHNITIPYQGGDSDSRDLDRKYGLQDYVRLSFCDDHPMRFRLEQSGYDLVILNIKVDVALFKNTLYSDMNAADKRHHHGGSLDDLKRVNFEATKMSYLRSDDPLFKKHQAEVMVKTFIPLEYIENIDRV